MPIGPGFIPLGTIDVPLGVIIGAHAVPLVLIVADKLREPLKNAVENIKGCLFDKDKSLTANLNADTIDQIDRFTTRELHARFGDELRDRHPELAAGMEPQLPSGFDVWEPVTSGPAPDASQKPSGFGQWEITESNGGTVAYEAINHEPHPEGFDKWDSVLEDSPKAKPKPKMGM